MQYDKFNLLLLAYLFYIIALMNKKIFTVSDFRKVLEQMIHGDRIHLSHGEDGSSWETLDLMEQTSDDELLKFKLYADLGMDSLDVWEIIAIFERDYEVSILDDVGEALGTGVSLTVKRFLDAVNTNQDCMD